MRAWSPWRRGGPHLVVQQRGCRWSRRKGRWCCWTCFSSWRVGLWRTARGHFRTGVRSRASVACSTGPCAHQFLGDRGRALRHRPTTRTPPYPDAVAHTLAMLMQMSDAELVQLYDESAPNTQVGVTFYREELARRAAD